MPKYAKSMTDVAFELMMKKKRAVSFFKLWDEVSQIMGFSQAQADERISQFYTNITLDSRFVSMPENKWDLRSRHRFEEVHIDASEILVIDETADYEVDDIAEVEADGDDDDSSDLEDFEEEELYTENTTENEF